MRLNNIYRTVSTCKIGNGASVCFWEDQWADGILATNFTRIASFAKSSSSSVQEILQATDLDSIFFLPLSTQETKELKLLQLHIQNFGYEEDNTDQSQPVWGSDYSSKSFYKHVFSALRHT